MPTLLSLPFLLPSLYLLQLMSSLTPSRGPLGPPVRDTLLTDLE